MKETRHYLIIWEAEIFRDNAGFEQYRYETPCDVIVNNKNDASYILYVIHNKIDELIERKNDRYKEKSENSYMRLNKIVNIIKL